MKRNFTPVFVVFFAFLALLVGRFWGSEGAPRLDVRTFTLENRSGFEAAELVGPYVFRDREGSPGTMSATSNALSVRETPDNLDRIARVLAEFDKPVPGIRLRFQLIEADSFREADPAIAEVVEELKGLFRFEGYRLLGEALVGVAGGSGGGQEFSQNFLGPDDAFSVTAQAEIRQPGTIRLDPVELWQDQREILLQTSVNVSPGQTVVIGGAQARVGGRSLILTVKAESE